MSDKDIDPTPYGFAKMKYAQVERERRWLCERLPDIVEDAEAIYCIEDLYVSKTNLRVRNVTLPDGTPCWPRVARKVSMEDPRHCLITSIYLSEEELQLLSALPGEHLWKKRYVVKIGGRSVAIDQFERALEGLVLAEAEFDDDDTMTAFAAPSFVDREVTEDQEFSGSRFAALSQDAARKFVRTLTP